MKDNTARYILPHAPLLLDAACLRHAFLQPHTPMLTLRLLHCHYRHAISEGHTLLHVTPCQFFAFASRLIFDAAIRAIGYEMIRHHLLYWLRRVIDCHHDMDTIALLFSLLQLRQ